MTPEGEKDWINVNAYEDDGHTVPSIPANTVMDCQRCHQVNGPSQGAILRMQETTAPYTHFFSVSPRAAKPDERLFRRPRSQRDLRGDPGNLIAQSNPSLFASFINTAGFGTQPNAFSSAQIEQEVSQSSPLQPANDSVSGTSPTWDLLFQNFIQGMSNPPPYHDVKITDPAKLAAMTQAYQAVMNGSQPMSSLPDIRQDMKDDPTFLTEMSFQIAPNQSAQAMLVNACMNCHNSNLDQTITRARFNVQTLSAMSPAGAQRGDFPDPGARK